jgi:glycosyltransferase involved in cell wall biosynthesis
VIELDRSNPLDVSVVVPVFNSASSLGALHDRIEAALDSVHRVDRWELILVNDGSSDGSWDRIVSLSRSQPEVRGLDLERNFGQHNALLAGVKAARHDVIVTLDDDLQNPPEEIPRLLDAFRRDLDIVYGVPIAKAHPRHRRIGAVGLRAILRVVTRRRDALLGSGFRAFRSTLAERLPEASGRRVVLDRALRGLTDRVGSVAVCHEPRRVGSSNYTLPMLIRFAVTEIATDLPVGARKRKGGPSYRVREHTGLEPSGDGRR